MSDAYQNPLGWHGVEPAMNEETKAAFERVVREDFELCIAFKQVFSTEQGAKVLNFLKRSTLESGTWLASLANGPGGLDAAQAHAFAREGQNALVRDMLRRITLAESKDVDDFIANRNQIA